MKSIGRTIQSKNGFERVVAPVQSVVDSVWNTARLVESTIATQFAIGGMLLGLTATRFLKDKGKDEANRRHPDLIYRRSSTGQSKGGIVEIAEVIANARLDPKQIRADFFELLYPDLDLDDAEAVQRALEDVEIRINELNE